MKYRHAAFTLIELTIALAIAALLAGAAIQTWSGHHERTQRAAARAALVSTMVELERQYAHTGNSSTPASVPEHVSGYHLLASPCDGRAPSHCIEVAALPVRPGIACGTLILRNTGERFTQIGNDRQPASSACWP
ncbi:prepilin-type N-terminal cleavage/methylation domain-containing protein [Ralstonia sp. CHL-2022]|uniref:Prepilin-type N-terminal cleavage/methylation domain-containing protein n=1 Tax=Ralstonia mojiangensis TaxID=2953895 RepID=A0AAE3I3Y1_9RALS|nr:prepilin-type N-terminal cleavage/methylation domain-containing protein [Ralstonia mojiangensis]MCT7317101.1 prepilin-type N-terminal cleavage/methylation domain-containing protein [Ralstonia mojiangensis]MCT7327713.1 prepilin-type N-terminal cleavage/methylation domain-containing protein [Ralstonia mojiangensis]